MSIDMRAFQPGWPHLDGAALRAALPQQIALGDIPALPLARASDMPAHAGFARGSLGLELSGLRLSIEEGGSLAPEASRDAQDRPVLALFLDGVVLDGRQTLQGTQIWEAGIDGAGTGLPPSVPRRGGADQDANPAWIQTANEQRAKLQQVPGGHGATMLGTYSNHRAAYNDAFTAPAAYAFQVGWGVPAISQMAEDTNTAVNNNTTVNDPTKQYGDMTYNGNAQNQQLALITTLTSLASVANPQNPKDPTNPYNLAAAAALTFGTSITTNTGVQKVSQVPPMDPSAVYTLVQTGKPATGHSVQDVYAFLSGSSIGGRDAQGNTWTMCLDEDERAFVRKMQADLAEHAARLAAQKPVALAAGGLKARLSCYLYLQFEEQAEGPPRLRDGRVELDGFDLEFDDSAWDDLLGPYLAHQAREALSEARFIKSLLHDRIADAMERALVQPITQAILSARL